MHIGALHYARYYNTTPRRSSDEPRDRGEVHIRTILASPSLSRSIYAYRMPSEAFLKLLRELQISKGLKDGRSASAMQKLAIFLIIVG